MTEFHFGSEAKHEERGHDGECGTTLPVGRFEEFLIAHGEIDSGGGWDEGDSSGDEAVVHGCRCRFCRSFRGGERWHVFVLGVVLAKINCQNCISREWFQLVSQSVSQFVSKE